jgi:adenylate cyclase
MVNICLFSYLISMRYTLTLIWHHILKTRYPMIFYYKYNHYKYILLILMIIIFNTSFVFATQDAIENIPTQSIFSSSILKFNTLNVQCYNLGFDQKKNLYIASDAGILYFNGYSWNLLNFQNPVFDIIITGDSLFCVTSNDLILINLNNLKHPLKKISLPKYFVNQNSPLKLIKYDGNLFIFSSPVLCLYEKNQFKILKNNVIDVYQRNNCFFTLTDSGNLYKFYKNKPEFLHKLPKSQKKFHFLNSNSNLFLVSDSNIIEFKESSNSKIDFISHKKLNNSTKSIFAVYDNYLFLSPTPNYLSFEHLGNSKIIHIPIVNPFESVFKCCIIKQNQIWLLYNEGLVMLSDIENAERSFNQFTQEQNSIIENITSETHFIYKSHRSFLYTASLILLLLFAVGVLAYLVFWYKRKSKKEKDNIEFIVNERTAELLREKNKTDVLIANILPKETATELKNTGKASSQKFDMATVLFSDIQGFTKIAEQLNPEKLIDQLDNFFFHFDSVVEKYNIEKIKTIGDAYMCAGGIPYKNRTNPVEVVLAALEMQEYMRKIKLRDENFWDLRIGIHTGAVIAGVVGHKKLSYDIWGDTVNTASRMESSGEAGKINISGHTYELVKDFFICEYRGRMPVKYKGDIDMYFVKGIRPELSVDLRLIPSRKFFIQLQLLRIYDLEEFVISRIENEMTQDFYFHSSKHTKDIYTQAELLSRAENVSPEEMLIVCSAALMLDLGFITNYHNHIIHSVNFARDILPKFRYSNDQIDTICNIMLGATTENNSPTLLETILIDARFNYFGRVDYIEKIENLIKEIKAWVPGFSPKDFIYQQIERMKKFVFYTDTAKKLQDVTPAEQIKKLEDFLKLYK